MVELTLNNGLTVEVDLSTRLHVMKAGRCVQRVHEWLDSGELTWGEITRGLAEGVIEVVDQGYQCDSNIYPETKQYVVVENSVNLAWNIATIPFDRAYFTEYVPAFSQDEIAVAELLWGGAHMGEMQHLVTPPPITTLRKLNRMVIQRGKMLLEARRATELLNMAV